MAVTATSVVATPAKYPSLVSGEVPFNTYQTIKLLHDKHQKLEDRLTAAEATITALVSANNSLETQLAAAKRQAEGGLGPRQEP